MKSKKPKKIAVQSVMEPHKPMEYAAKPAKKDSKPFTGRKKK